MKYTPTEIREIARDFCPSDGVPSSEVQAQIFFLAEIAAQLAEFNAKNPVEKSETFTNPSGEVVTGRVVGGRW